MTVRTVFPAEHSFHKKAAALACKTGAWSFSYRLVAHRLASTLHDTWVRLPELHKTNVGTGPEKKYSLPGHTCTDRHLGAGHAASCLVCACAHAGKRSRC